MKSKKNVTAENKTEQRKPGRPSDYSFEQAKRVCEEIANSSKGIKTILDSNPDYPYKSVFYRWLENNKELQDLYAQAKQDQLKNLADELLEIADNGALDTKIDENGREVVDYENIQRSRLRVDTRKWLLSKLVPKVYGDRVLNEHSGADGKPIEYANLNESERLARIETILNRARVRRDSDTCGSD